MNVSKRWKGVLMMMSIVALSVVVFSCNDDDDDSNNNALKKNYTITGNANGNQVVPTVGGTGAGTITGTYNPNTRVFNYTNTWTDLTGAPTSGGFYRGASGVNGLAVGTPWTYNGSASGTGTYTGTMTLTRLQEQQLLAGNWYYGYNTATNTNGEVRGQIATTQVQ